MKLHIIYCELSKHPFKTWKIQPKTTWQVTIKTLGMLQRHQVMPRRHQLCHKDEVSRYQCHKDYDIRLGNHQVIKCHSPRVKHEELTVYMKSKHGSISNSFTKTFEIPNIFTRFSNFPKSFLVNNIFYQFPKYHKSR